MRRIVVTSLLILAAGCEPEPTPLGIGAEEIAVHSMLVAGSDVARVLIQRVKLVTIAGGFEGDRQEVQAVPESGAIVELRTGTSVVRLREAPPGFAPCTASRFAGAPAGPIEAGCYAAEVPGGIREGEEYRLAIDLGGEADIEGITSIPVGPTIRSPVNGVRRTVQIGFSGEPSSAGFAVAYDAAPSIRGLEGAIRIDRAFQGDEADPAIDCQNLGNSSIEAPSDTLYFELFWINCYRRVGGGFEPADADSVQGAIVLTAYDSTYLSYVEAFRGSSAPLSAARAGLTGAFGLFAGAATSEVSITLVASEPAARGSDGP